MYNVKPNLIIGFHGCDADICRTILNDPDNIKIKKNPYDWLGHGMYLWENNYERALQWAIDKQRRGAIREPAVIGALLQPGNCCDFLDTQYIRILAGHYKLMEERYEKTHIQICIRNLNCIKGFFLPRRETDFLNYSIVNEPGWPLEFQLWQ